MVSEEYSNKIKKIKTKTKRSANSDPKLGIILIIFIILGVLAIGYMFYDMEKSKKEEAIKELNTAKNNGIESINKMYGSIKSPNKEVYIAEVKNAKNTNEINNVLNKARADVEFENNKLNEINKIKKIYDKYYEGSVFAKIIVGKINSAKSNNEINTIIESNMDKINEELRNYYLTDLLNNIDENKNYSVNIGGKPKRFDSNTLKQYISKLSLPELKKFKFEAVDTYSEIPIVINAIQCGKMPLKGDTAYIYNKENVTMPPIESKVVSSYVIASDISYSESKSLSNNIQDGSGDSVSSSASSSVSYNLGNINGILKAAAIKKLNEKQIEDKFGEYGIRLNELSDKTQIFDKKVDYVLIISVPSEMVSKIINIDPKNMYVATER